MPIVYEVNLKVVKSISATYLDWLNEHIKDMLQLPGFTDAKLYQEVQEMLDHDHFVVQYHLESESDLNSYLSNQAPQMRQQGLNLFGNQFSATRRVLKKF